MDVFWLNFSSFGYGWFELLVVMKIGVGKINVVFGEKWGDGLS